MTMMIRPREPSSSSSSSQNGVTVDEALGYLTHHLQPKTPLPRPVFFRSRIMKGCIPVPTVGHTQRMEEMKRVAREEWDGRLEVIGAGVGGVSVADCVEQGRQVGRSWT